MVRGGGRIEDRLEVGDKTGRVMMILKATVFMGGLTRVVKVGVFREDKRGDILQRYRRRLTKGFESAILNRLIKYVRDENDSDGISASVEMEPFCGNRIMHEYCEIRDVEDLCDKFTEVSMMVLSIDRRDGV